jgi:hypothetical protein
VPVVLPSNKSSEARFHSPFPSFLFPPLSLHLLLLPVLIFISRFLSCFFILFSFLHLPLTYSDLLWWRKECFFDIFLLPLLNSLHLHQPSSLLFLSLFFLLFFLPL